MQRFKQLWDGSPVQDLNCRHQIPARGMQRHHAHLVRNLRRNSNCRHQIPARGMQPELSLGLYVIFLATLQTPNPRKGNATWLNDLNNLFAITIADTKSPQGECNNSWCSLRYFKLYHCRHQIPARGMQLNRS